MTDPTPPPGSHDDADARIGAWLDGELSDAGAEEFEAELARDAELAARVEAVRAVRERLAGAPADVPAGFAERVAHGIAAGSDQPSTADPPSTADRPASLAHARSRRERRRRRLVAAGSVAAALVAVAVIVPIFGGWGDRSDRDTASTADIAQEDAGDTESAGGDGAAEAPRELGEAQQEARDTSAATDATAGPQAAAPEPSSRDVPTIVSRRRAFATREALVQHFVPRAAAAELLGVPADEAQRLAEHSRAALRDAPPLSGGTPADACVAATAAAVDGSAVFARVQPVRLTDSPLIAHVVATGSPGAALDALRLHVRDPAQGCDAVLTRRLA